MFRFRSMQGPIRRKLKAFHHEYNTNATDITIRYHNNMLLNVKENKRVNRSVFMNVMNNTFSSTAGSGSSLDISSENNYVHPLSQIVLQHLQQSEGAVKWLEGFESNVLTLAKDGTFNLRFSTGDDGVHKGRIWTQFDAEEGKHYLNVHLNDLVGRYVLQDNKKPAWHLNQESTPERVQNAVDDMIDKLVDAK